MTVDDGGETQLAFLDTRPILHFSHTEVCRGQRKEMPPPALVLVLGGVVFWRHDQSSALPGSSVHNLHDVNHLRGGGGGGSGGGGGESGVGVGAAVVRVSN